MILKREINTENSFLEVFESDRVNKLREFITSQYYQREKKEVFKKKSKTINERKKIYKKK